MANKPVVWWKSEIKTPPLSEAAREEIGRLIRRVQRGLDVTMPHARPMPTIGRHCYELRVTDADATWRVIYRIDDDAIVVVYVFSKKSQTTPQLVKETSRKRLADYDRLSQGGENHG